MIILQPEHQLSMNSTVFLQLLTTNSTFSNSHEQQQNYMLNPISELYHLRLEDISPTLTIDW